MDHKQFREWDKKFYQELKKATKGRKLKLSAEHDIYKKEGPYFYHAFYWLREVEDGKAEITLDITVKYHRFDELNYGIIMPGNELRFTDKIRANSGALCHASFPRMTKIFACDGSEEAIPRLCEDLLDFLKTYASDFLAEVTAKYGDLNGYYIAHKDENPRLAGLAYLDRGDIQGAIECFSSPDIGGEHSVWSVTITTDEQRRRALENGKQILSDNSIWRSRKEQYNDYAVALKNGLEWNRDRAMCGLLAEERNMTV